MPLFCKEHYFPHSTIGNHLMIRIILLVAILYPAASFSQTVYSLADIPLELMENANSVVIDENVEIDVTTSNKLIWKSYSAMAILNENGDKAMDNVFRYDKDSKVSSLEAYVYDAFGSELAHYKKRDFLDVSEVSGGTLYSDSRVLYLDYTPTTYPYFFVVEAERENNTTAFIPPWYPVNRYTQSAKKSVFKLKYGDSNELRYKAYNLGDSLNISIIEGENEILCTAKNIKATSYENSSPVFAEIFPNVMFAIKDFYLKGVSGTASNWSEFGKWRYDNLVKDLDALSPATIMSIDQLLVGVEGKREKVKKIYEYVQDKTRYISVQLGVGGWRPYEADVVDKLGYGDCKGLTNYTKALLKTQKIESYYTVVWAGEERKNIRNDFTSMQGNHVILNVPMEDEDIWLECTSQILPFDFLGDFTDDRDVLVLKPEGGEIVHTRIYDYKSNLMETKVELHVRNDGSAKVNYNCISKGLQYNKVYFIERKDKSDLDKYYLEKWGNINGYSMDHVSIHNNKDDIKFEENLKLTIPSYASKVGDKLLLSVNVFNQLDYVPVRIPNRKQKLRIKEGFMDKDLVELSIPSDFVFEELPEAVHIENQFGRYSIIFSKLSENKIEYKREVILKKGTFPPEEYSNYRSFLRKITRLDKTKILLSPKI